MAPPKPGDISADAQAVLDRAAAAYKGAKTYRETVLTTLRQKAKDLVKDAEPPTDQASTTTHHQNHPTTPNPAPRSQQPPTPPAPTHSHRPLVDL